MSYDFDENVSFGSFSEISEWQVCAKRRRSSFRSKFVITFVITLSISRQNHPDQVAHRPSRTSQEIRHDRPDSVELLDLMASLLRGSDKAKRLM
jgi:hypothetical protein